MARANLLMKIGDVRLLVADRNQNDRTGPAQNHAGTLPRTPNPVEFFRFNFYILSIVFRRFRTRQGRRHPMPPMENSDACLVTHVSYSPLGGAGVVAARLAAAQRRLGRPAELISLVRTPFPRWAARHPSTAAAALFDYFAVRKGARSAFFSLYRRRHAARIARALAERPGILHLHWLPGMLWPPAFFSRPIRARKIVWTAHDFWPATGGCHFPYDCDRFASDCEDCPQVRPMFRRAVATAYRRKMESLRERPDICVVAPSEWLRAELHKNAFFRGLARAVIPNPVDTEIFRPGDVVAARAAVGLPPDAFVVGLGAADLRDERKQIEPTLRLLKDWFAQRPDAPPCRALIFGAGGPFRGLPPEFVFVGTTTDRERLSGWYNAMNVFVSLSRYETLGNTLAEAAACAIPTIVLAGSGASEVVLRGRTGELVDAPEAMLHVLDQWRQNPALLSHLGRQAREFAVSRFAAEAVARRYLELYCA